MFQRAIATGIACAVCGISPSWAADPSELEIALGLSKMLQSARAVISSEQDRINDAALGNKGLTGDAVIARGAAAFKETTGTDPTTMDRNSRYGKLMAAELQAIRNVMTEVQSTINKQGIGFKGFVPAVFGRMVTENFQHLAAGDAEIKVTAPRELVRNRKALPDEWEAAAIRDRLDKPDWEKGKVYSAVDKKDGRDAFRIAIPEYYTAGCLTCHGAPKGELDVTGYPKEGGKLDDLGGVISITLYR